MRCLLILALVGACAHPPMVVAKRDIKVPTTETRWCVSMEVRYKKHVFPAEGCVPNRALCERAYKLVLKYGSHVDIVKVTKCSQRRKEKTKCAH